MRNTLGQKEAVKEPFNLDVSVLVLKKIQFARKSSEFLFRQREEILHFL